MTTNNLATRYSPRVCDPDATRYGLPLIGSGERDRHNDLMDRRVDHDIAFSKRPGGQNDHIKEVRYCADGSYTVAEWWPGFGARVVERWHTAEPTGGRASLDRVIGIDAVGVLAEIS